MIPGGRSTPPRLQKKTNARINIMSCIRCFLCSLCLHECLRKSTPETWNRNKGDKTYRQSDLLLNPASIIHNSGSIVISLDVTSDPNPCLTHRPHNRQAARNQSLRRRKDLRLPRPRELAGSPTPVCMYMYMCVCIHIYIYTHVYIIIYTYVYI